MSAMADHDPWSVGPQVGVRLVSEIDGMFRAVKMFGNLGSDMVCRLCLAESE